MSSKGKLKWEVLAKHIEPIPVQLEPQVTKDKAKLQDARVAKITALIRNKHPQGLQRINEIVVWDPPPTPKTWIMIAVWSTSTLYVMFALWYLGLYLLDITPDEGMTWLQTCGLSLLQSLIVGEPLKFLIVASIVAFLPTRAKVGCIRFLQMSIA